MTSETLPDVQRVIGPSSPLFRPSIDIIHQSIPASEQIDEPRLLRLIERDDYRLYTLRIDGQVVGAALLFLPSDERFGLLDYMAVRPDLRNRALGSTLFRALIGIMSEERPGADCLILEVDDDRRGDDDARLMAGRRIRFYQRLGAKLLANVDYLFPSHHGPAVPMRLMVYRLHDEATLSRAALGAAIGVIFTSIHGRAKKDDLLRRITEQLPSELVLG